ncbi:hypothetical protein L7F22_048718 [Adiantum nelumboides]|nr:hypothetical protein [Adiantum nelumboides]
MASARPVNDLEVVEVPLKTEGGAFSLDVEKVLATLAADPSIKLVFLCSPGNPTGTLLDLGDMERILNFEQWHGLVVVDEAYIDFAEEEIHMGKRTQAVSAVELTKSYKNVVVTQTLSKAYGLAAIRLGIAYAQPALVQILNNTKAPYNIGVPPPTWRRSPDGRGPVEDARERADADLAPRLARRCAQRLAGKGGHPGRGAILGANEANFVLVQLLDDAGRAERAAVRDRVQAHGRGAAGGGEEPVKGLGCDGCLRITVGTEEENLRVIELMRQLLRDGKWS